MAALQGVPLAARPDLWQPYEAAQAAGAAGGQAGAASSRRASRAQAADIDAVLQQPGRDAATAVYLPMVGAQGHAWTVLLDAGTAEVVGYLPLDSF